MIKKTFTVAEAATWLAARVAEPITEGDVIREAAEGRMPVCFDYRGNVAVYPRPPAGNSPRSVHYFVGLLRSQSPVQLRTRIDKVSPRRGPGGTLILNESVEYADILRPNLVDVATQISADPPIPGIDSDECLARYESATGIKNSNVPKSEWLFHLDDLLALAPNRGHAATASPPPESDCAVEPVNEGQLKSTPGIGTRAYWRRVLYEHIGEIDELYDGEASVTQVIRWLLKLDDKRIKGPDSVSARISSAVLYWVDDSYGSHGLSKKSVSNAITDARAYWRTSVDSRELPG